MMTVKKPDNSDDATDEDCIYDKTDEDKGQVRLPKQMNFRKNSKRSLTPSPPSSSFSENYVAIFSENI